MKKYNCNINDVNFILEEFFGISNKIIDDLIFKLENNKELNFSDYLLIDRIKMLNFIIQRRKK